jgi:hypothetical protein
MLFKSKSSKSTTTTVKAPVATEPQLPSPEVVSRIRELVEQVARAKAELAIAKRTLTLAAKNRESVELFADPDEVVRKAKTAADLAEGKLSGVQNELTRLFVSEGTRCEKLRSEAWARTFNEVVLPLAKQFAAIAEEFEQAVDGVAALFRDDSDAMTQFKAIDAGVAEWNKLAVELGAPGNAALDSKSFVVTFRESLTKSMQIRDRLEVALTRLKNAINPPPPVPKPLTEEEIVKIREQQRLTTAARVKELDDEDSRARTAIVV